MDQTDVCCVYGSGWSFVAVVSPGWLCLRWGVIRPFAWFCARSGLLDACGAVGKLPGRSCAASV